MSVEGYINTDWLCPQCGSKLIFKVSGSLELRLKCNKCDRFYIGRVAILPPINKARTKFNTSCDYDSLQYM